MKLIPYKYNKDWYLDPGLQKDIYTPIANIRDDMDILVQIKSSRLLVNDVKKLLNLDDYLALKINILPAKTADIMYDFFKKKFK